VRSRYDRWRSDEGRTLARDLLARLVSNRSLEGLDIADIDGLADLRGFALPDVATEPYDLPTGWQGQRLRDPTSMRNVSLQRLDFTHALLKHLRIFDSTIQDCRFDYADCSDFRAWGTTIANCSFRKANLQAAALGTGSDHAARNVWSSIDFTGANLRKATVVEAVFRDCDFSSATINGLEFRQCEFVRCRFAGRMRDVIFDGGSSPGIPTAPTFREVDFADARIEMCEFRGCEFVDSIYPADPDVLVVNRFREKAERALQELANLDTSVYLINRHDYLAYPSGSELVDLADRLLG
jgi:uncharacterized protein YjbI with pentapeptide repeats